MTHPARPTVDLDVALARRTLPSVTVYNRLEGRPRTRSFDRSLRAEVRDALWMCTRQWQLGEYAADDAGSPIVTTVHVEHTRLTEFGPRDTAPAPFTSDLPLETRVERRPVVLELGDVELALDLRLAMGRRWSKLLADPASGLNADHRTAFRDAYAFTAPDPMLAADAGRAAHRRVWQAFAAVAGRAIDGGLLYQHLTASPPGRPYDGVAGIPMADRPLLDALGARFVAWFEHLVVPAAAEDQDCWDPQRLEYRFSARAPDGAGGTRDYVADSFHGGRVDWYAMDLAHGVEPVEGAPAGPEMTAETAALLPSPVVFHGMPATRWWEFEDRRVNLGAVDAATTDIGTLLFLEFALVYANDWFLVPIDVPVGSIVRARGVVVTTVFGERFWITPAGSGDDDVWQRWSIFSTSLVGPGLADTALLVLPTVAKVQEGEPLERVALIRDEMANMVWGIEEVVPAGSGGGMPGALAAAEAAAYFTRLAAATPVPVPAEPRVADVRYQVMGSVDEQWIPFVPVHVPGDDRQIQLQRAGLPRIVPGSPPVRVEPRTALLRTGRDLPAPEPYFLHEEEVPRAGIVVHQAFRRTRTSDGRAIVWCAVGRRVGRGEGSSGLAFDQLLHTPAEPA